MSELGTCPMCDRALVPGPSVDGHHLVPVLKGGRKKEPVHRICHTKIHSLWSENELRDTYNNWPAIRADDRIQKFVRWLSKKPADYYDSNRIARGHKKRRRR